MKTHKNLFSVQFLLVFHCLLRLFIWFFSFAFTSLHIMNNFRRILFWQCVRAYVHIAVVFVPKKLVF